MRAWLRTQLSYPGRVLLLGIVAVAGVLLLLTGGALLIKGIMGVSTIGWWTFFAAVIVITLIFAGDKKPVKRTVTAVLALLLIWGVRSTVSWAQRTIERGKLEKIAATRAAALAADSAKKASEPIITDIIATREGTEYIPKDPFHNCLNFMRTRDEAYVYRFKPIDGPIDSVEVPRGTKYIALPKMVVVWAQLATRDTDSLMIRAIEAPPKSDADHR